LDREAISNYEIKIIAKDQGPQPLSSTATVNLKIDDQNDNKPAFYPEKYFMNLEENQPIGSFVVQVLAHDIDYGSPFTAVISPDCSTILNISLESPPTIAYLMIFPGTDAVTEPTCFTTGFVTVNLPVGHEVFLCSAIDLDAGMNSVITYALQPPNNIFEIDINTGMISTIYSFHCSDFPRLFYNSKHIIRIATNYCVSYDFSRH
jgi:hypothetical protein